MATVVSEMIGVTVVREATVVIEVTGATVEVVVAAEVAGEAEEEALRVAEGLEKETRIPKSQQQSRKPKLMPEKKITGTVS